MSFLTGTEKSRLLGLAKANDLYAQAYEDHRSFVDHLRAGSEGYLVKARVKTTAQKSLTGLSAIDGKTPVAGDVVLVASQDAGAENGLYVAASGAWTQLKDSDGAHAEKAGMLVLVSEGSTNGNSLWQLTTDSFTVGTDSIAFTALNVTTLATNFTLAAVGTTLTIASGVVTATQSHHKIDTEAAAASDDLDTISGGAVGKLLFVYLNNAAHNVVLKHGTGNLKCQFGQDITLDAATDAAMLLFEGTTWSVLGFKTDAADGGGTGLIIGLLSALATTDKSSVVNAVNEVRTNIKDTGWIAAARIQMSSQPTTGDTLTIGANVYEFVTALGSVADDTHIGVPISAVNAAGTQANLLAAINGAVGAPTGLTKIDTVTAALRNGTVSVLGTSIGTQIRVQPASGVGGTAVVGAVSIVLAESITAAADIWDIGNVNMNTLGGAATLRQQATAQVTLTAAMVTNGVHVDFPFTPVGFSIRARKSDGGARAGAVTDLANIANGGVVLSGLGQAAPAYQATDILWITAWSA